MTTAADELTARRASLRNLLDRAARGILVSPGEGALLRQHVEAEIREADSARAALARVQALADEYPAGIDTALIHAELPDQPGPATAQATEPAGLRARIAHTLRTTPNRHATTQLRFPDHHGPSEGYLGWCALCTRDVEALTEALLAAVTEHLDIGEEQAWCKTCRRAWNSAARRCETDAEQQAYRLADILRTLLSAEDAPTHCHTHPVTWDGGGPCVYCTALAAARTAVNEEQP